MTRTYGQYSWQSNFAPIKIKWSLVLLSLSWYGYPINQTFLSFSIQFQFSFNMVVTKYCIFSKVLKYILVLFLSVCVLFCMRHLPECQCLHTNPLDGRSVTQSYGIVQKMNIQSLWFSCSLQKNYNISWMPPPSIFIYIIIRVSI